MSHAILVTIVLSLLSAVANASGEGATGWTSVYRLHPNASGLSLQVTNGINDPSACGGGDNSYMILLPTHPQYKINASALFLGFALHKTLEVITNGCSGNVSTIDSIVLKK